MNKETFGSSHQYKMLEFLTEKISSMDDKHRNYLSSVIEDINSITKKTEEIADIPFKNYVLNLIYVDLKKRIREHILNKYDKKIVSYLENYLHAKIKNTKQR